MKWPRLRNRRIKLTKGEETIALNQSKSQLKQVRSKWPEVNDLVKRLGSYNESNHFTQLITEAMQGGKR